MNRSVMLVLVFSLAGAITAAADDLGNQAPVKMLQASPACVANPERQGGDTIATALLIPSLPFAESGTTTGYADDYDEMCPYGGSAPDVVYKYVPTTTQGVTIDLCGSSYDTKVYVFNEAHTLIACNDDYYGGPPCGVYVSRLVNVPLVAGVTYYIFVDGYGNSSGTYLLDISVYVPCVLDCPAGGFAEGEPPLVDDYVDNYNSGCSEAFTFWQTLTADADGALTLCGVSGWYQAAGAQYRDTDWYTLTMGGSGQIEITGDAEYATYLFELGPQDCAAVDVITQTTAGPCVERSLTITGYAPDAPVWFWVGPTTFVPPSDEISMYDYVVWFSGLAPGDVATEATTWGSLKALYE